MDGALQTEWDAQGCCFHAVPPGHESFALRQSQMNIRDLPAYPRSLPRTQLEEKYRHLTPSDSAALGPLAKPQPKLL